MQIYFMPSFETADRVQRYLEDELGECRNEDLQRRLRELEDLESFLDPETISEDVETLSALGTETRYRLTRLLVEAEGELCVCEITPLMDVSDSAVSHALGTLIESGLVTKRKDGRWRKYRATTKAGALLAVLDGTR